MPVMLPIVLMRRTTSSFWMKISNRWVMIHRTHRPRYMINGLKCGSLARRLNSDRKTNPLIISNTEINRYNQNVIKVWAPAESGMTDGFYCVDYSINRSCLN